MNEITVITHGDKYPGQNPGLTLNGVWTPVTIYDDPTTVEFLMTEMEELVKGYKDTPGLLLYLLGNENNYGLFWAGAETEDFPDDEGRIQFIGESRGRPMYRLMNEAAKKMKEMDPSHPVAICNGDVLFIDIVAEEANGFDACAQVLPKRFDVWGSRKPTRHSHHGNRAVVAFARLFPHPTSSGTRCIMRFARLASQMYCQSFDCGKPKQIHNRQFVVQRLVEPTAHLDQ